MAVKSVVCRKGVHEEFKIKQNVKYRHKGTQDWYWCIHTYKQIRKATKKKSGKWPKKGYHCIAEKACQGQEFLEDERVGRCRQCRKPIYGQNCIDKYWCIYMGDM